MSYSFILFEAGSDGILTVTINRPDKLNALNAAIITELEDATARFAADSALRGLILTGAGEKAFVAGADIQELAMLTPRQAQEYSARGQRVFRRLETCGKPSVAAVNGYALGGGMELAMACMVRFASPNAKLGLPEVKLGILPGYGGTQRLPRLVGRGRALEMLISGEPVAAEEACQIGLVNRVVPQPELVASCRVWLEKALGNGPLAQALAAEAVDVGYNSGMEEGLRFEAAAFGLASATEDRAEGLGAFLEKRKASFRGK